MYKRILPAALLLGAAAPPALGQLTDGAEFNPAISLTLMGQYSNYHGVDELNLPGFQLGGEAGMPDSGFSLDHSEATMSANVDPYFFGQLTAALSTHGDNTEVELEEAFIETTSLPAGLGLTFGRFLSGIGYVNSKHSHVQDFVDAPLPAQAFLGGSYYDDGVRLEWVAPAALFVETGAEALRGGSFPAQKSAGSGMGAYSVFVRIGGDIGIQHNWRVGLSRLWARPDGRTGGHSHSHDHDHDHDHDQGHGYGFSGSSDLNIVDITWKWAPTGNLQNRSLTVQTEYYDRDESGRLTSQDAHEITDYSGRQKGLYAHAVYRFKPRWRTGLRYDRASSNNHGSDDALLAAAGLSDAGTAATRYSAMLDFSPSEFSRVRLQYTRNRLPDDRGNAVFLQYIMSIGAHGAHQF